MAKSNEPLWWVPFMGGAVISAFLMPVMVLAIGIMTYFGWTIYGELWDLLDMPWVRVGLVILIAFSLFHGFHRILYVLIDLGLKGIRGILAVLCYGSAIVGTVIALLVALRVWP